MREPTKGNNIAEQTKLSKVELSLNNLLTATKQRARDRCSVAECQTNDTNTRESVESGSGTEVDQTEHELNNHAHHHSVDRYIKLCVDNPPHLVARDATITSEGVDGAGRRSCATDTAEQSENHEREQQTDSASRRAYSVRNYSWGRLPRQESSKVSLVGHNEDEGDEEDETADGVEDDGADHSLGDLSRRVTDLFAHTIDGVSTWTSIRLYYHVFSSTSRNG